MQWRHPSWKPFHIIILLATVCLYTLPAGSYEDAPLVYVSRVVPENLQKSLLHSIEDMSVRDGVYHFYLDSNYGVYEVASTHMLRERVREILILGNGVTQLNREVEEKEPEVRGQLEIRSDRALDIITRPVDSASNLAGQMAGNLSETFAGSIADHERAIIYAGDENDDPVFALHKRNIASQWQLDVYSTNSKIQDFLSTVARSRSAGRISAGTPVLNRFAVETLPVEDEALEFQLRNLIKANNVVSLKEINDTVLARLGIDKATRLTFLNHPAFSPRHKTRITHYLELLAGTKNLAAVLKTTEGIDNEHDALGVELTVMMLADYHVSTAALAELIYRDHILYARTADNALVSIITKDLVYWSEGIEQFINRFSDIVAELGSTDKQLLSMGTFTDEARSQLEARQFIVQGNYLGW